MDATILSYLKTFHCPQLKHRQSVFRAVETTAAVHLVQMFTSLVYENHTAFPLILYISESNHQILFFPLPICLPPPPPSSFHTAHFTPWCTAGGGDCRVSPDLLEPPLAAPCWVRGYSAAATGTLSAPTSNVLVGHKLWDMQ